MRRRETASVRRRWTATPKTKARTAAFVEAQATSPKPSVATSAAQAFADHISWSGAPRTPCLRARRGVLGWLVASTELFFDRVRDDGRRRRAVLRLLEARRLHEIIIPRSTRTRVMPPRATRFDDQPDEAAARRAPS